jgi:hypothetical protein
MRLLLFSLLLVATFPAPAEAADPSCFELRTYHAAEGKLNALNARFRNHTLALFEKHGITNLGYWTPQSDDGQVLIYLLAYPDKPAREASWKAFLADPVWQAAKTESEKAGKLVAKVESRFLHLTDFSPRLPLPASNAPRAFEMRVYTTLPGKLAALDARFRDHTIALFEKHGMTNLLYFHLDAGQENSDNTLLYFLAHASAEAQAASFTAFRNDPDWISARDASEKDGKLLVDQGVKSTLLTPTDYSPAK